MGEGVHRWLDPLNGWGCAQVRVCTGGLILLMGEGVHRWLDPLSGWMRVCTGSHR